jgi:tetratricopeptide (TPR) repeat protein
MTGPLLAVVFLALAVPASSRAAVPAASDSVYSLAEQLLRSGSPDSALVLVTPIVERAHAANEAAVELVGRLHQAAALALVGRLREAEQVSRTATELAALLNEPGRGRMASRWLGYALLGQGRPAEALVTYRQLLDQAAAAGDRREEAYARTGLAYLALGRGETTAAREEYQRAAPLFHAVGETGMELDALVGLARTLGRDGRYQEMSRLYERIIREGEQAGLKRVVGYALNNLGTYEYQTGDPGRAVAYWQRVLDAKDSGTDPSGLIVPALNLALARMELGAFDEASSALEVLRARCQVAGYRLQETQILMQMAAVEWARGNVAGAIATWRGIMGAPDAGRETRVDAALQVATALDSGAGAARSLAFCDTVAALLAEGGTPQQKAELDLHVAGSLARLGRHVEAVPAARRAAAGMRQAGFRETEMAALVQLAGSEVALAGFDSALVHLRRAQRVWEDLRAVPRDPQWREQRGSLGSSIHLDLAALLLTHPAELPLSVRTARAFDSLQHFKARTLLERRLGPDGVLPTAANGVPSVGLDELQHDVLEPGAVLLDIYVGQHGSLMFAVTDTSCRAVSLPPEPILRDHVRLFLDLVALAPAPGEDVLPFRPAALHLGREVLAPVAPELRSATRVTIAADGILNRLPFGLLPWDLADAAQTPLGDRREVARVPSATLLARLRGREAVAGTPGVFVLAGAGAASLAALPGVATEARHLDRGYRNVAVASPGCAAGAEEWGAALAGRAILHVPAHTETFDQRPWNSRIAVGSAEDGATCWLTSGEIADLPLGADLTVLSGCSSAGGRALAGEGVLGLTGAFLAAGSHAVVASLWDVDDVATATLMQEFYAGLAAGETVAGALGAAQCKVARQAATTAPCYWAGFVVVGDGNVRVILQNRPAAWAGSAGAGTGLVAALGALIWLQARRRGRRVISWRGRSPS